MTLMQQRLAVIGAGNMGEALIRGLLAGEAVEPTSVVATGRRQKRLEYLASTYNVSTTLDNAEAARNADVVILAIKPQILARIMAEVTHAIPDASLVVSVLAGVSTASLESHLRPRMAVCRAMPNTPAIVGAGATAIAAGSRASEAHMEQVRAVFEAVGEVIQVDEALLDAVTGLSGSGPAYVMMIIEALSDAGVKVGLPRYQAQALAAQTVLGSAQLLLETQEHPGVLKDRVTSPGGTAIAGLHTLEEGGLRTTLINAVVAATARSRELGKDSED